MKSDLISRILKYPGTYGVAGRRFESPEKLVKVAKEHFARDFGNPTRYECPPARTFSDLIGAHQLPGEKILSHLLICSECFREYRSALNSSVPDPAVTSAWPSNLKGKPLRRAT